MLAVPLMPIFDTTTISVTISSITTAYRALVGRLFARLPREQATFIATFLTHFTRRAGLNVVVWALCTGYLLALTVLVRLRVASPSWICLVYAYIIVRPTTALTWLLQKPSPFTGRRFSVDYCRAKASESDYFPGLILDRTDSFPS